MIGGRTVPAWVNEGLATVLESADQPVVDAMPRTGARTDLRVSTAVSLISPGATRKSLTRLSARACGV